MYNGPLGFGGIQESLVYDNFISVEILRGERADFRSAEPERPQPDRDFILAAFYISKKLFHVILFRDIELSRTLLRKDYVIAEGRITELHHRTDKTAQISHSFARKPPCLVVKQYLYV